MAAARRIVWLPIFRPKNASLIIARLQKRDFCSASTDIALLQKLLKSPVSRIKSTLDSDFTSHSTEFPSPALLSSLYTSAPNKANLIIEWKLEKLTKEDERSQDSYARLISLCQNIRNLPIALLVFSSMEAQGVSPTSSIFNALVSTSLSSGNFLTALSLFEIMECSADYRPDSDTYNVLISTYANLGNKSATEAWLKAKKASGFSADAQTYGVLMCCCIKSRAFEDAQRYYDEMMLEGLVPDVSVFQDVLLMHCRLRNSGKVKEILKFMVNGGLRVDGNTSKKVVELCRELGLVEEVEEELGALVKSSRTS